MQQRIDPILVSLLEQARASKEPLQVVVVLRPESGKQFSAPERTEVLASELIKKVEQETGEAPLRFNVFRNLSSVAVEATPNFIRGLLAKDEVISAIANQRSGSPGRSKVPSSAPERLQRDVASKANPRPTARSSSPPALPNRSKSVKKK